MKIFLFTVGLVFCMNIFAKPNPVWFECGQADRGKFKGLPKHLGFFHDLPKNKSKQVTKATMLDFVNVTWQTGEAISDTRGIYIRIETPDGPDEGRFDREKLTYKGWS